jgi:cobalt-zinc-cadmium efflux system membrane fusion protein
MKTSILFTAALLLGLAACGNDPQPAAAAEHADHDEHEAEEGPIRLSEEQMKIGGLVIATAGPASIREVLPVYGSIAPNAERVHEVAARFPGVIRSVVKSVGDTVRQGETLATLESNESLQTYAVTAPIGGVITRRNANAGEQSGERSLFTVADLSTVWVELALFPRDLPKVRIGQTVRVRSADAGLAAEGRVVYVAPFGSGASQTLTARVQLANPERHWAPGLYVSADVVLSQKPAALTIRNESVQAIDGRDSVFVEEAAGEFAARPVRLGRSDGEVSEVLEGIEAGTRYVAANSFILKSHQGAASAGHEH